MSPFRVTIAATFLISFAGLAGAGQVHVVGAIGDPLADFNVLADAVSAASDGDLIQVTADAIPGTLSPQGKSLFFIHMQHPSGELVPITPIDIKNQPADRPVVLRGFRGFNFPPPFSSGFGAELQNNAGGVLLEDCYSAGIAGARIQNCAAVVMARTELVGIDMDDHHLAGLFAADSSVSLYGCELRGKRGDNAGIPLSLFPGSDGEVGDPGLIVANGDVMIAGSDVLAGDGGDGVFFEGQCFLPGDGGPSIRVEAGTTTIRLLASAIEGGEGGTAGSGCSPDGLPGDEIELAPGAAVMQTQYADDYRELRLQDIVNEGDSATIEIDGLPGELAFLVLAPSLDILFAPGLTGTLVPSLQNLALLSAGVIPASGTQSLSVGVPNGTVPPGDEYLPVVAQVLVAGANGTGVLGGPSVMAILDA